MKTVKNRNFKIIGILFVTFLFASCSAEQLPCERVIQPGYVLVE